MQGWSEAHVELAVGYAGLSGGFDILDREFEALEEEIKRRALRVGELVI